MDQISKKTVLDKIKIYWPDLKSREVLSILNKYGDEDYHKEQVRVHLAILKLSEGQLDKLESYLESARSDYRDVLAWAEYPEEMMLGYTAKSQMTPDQITELRRRDREQYLNWLRG